jgi:hypothetical protein
MVTPQRSDRTLGLRAVGRAIRTGKIRESSSNLAEELPDAEELTRPGVHSLPEQPESRTLHQQWVGLPLWVRIVVALVPTVPIIVGAIVQIVQILSVLR